MFDAKGKSKNYVMSPIIQTVQTPPFSRKNA